MTRIIPNMPFAEYKAAPGINASLLKIVWQRSLAHGRAYLDGTYRPESDALSFGKCFHALCLEDREMFVEKPATYTDDKGAVKPWNANANACKAWLETNADRVALSAGDVASLRSMTATVRSHPELAGMFTGRVELAVFAEYKGAAVKMMLDLLPDRIDAPVIDLKSCYNAEPEAFMREAVRLGYHLQAAFYLDVLRWAGIKRNAVWFVAVESEPPHGLAILKFHDAEESLLRRGRQLYRAALQQIVNAQQSGHWPSYESRQAEDVAPIWAMRELIAA